MKFQEGDIHLFRDAIKLIVRKVIKEERPAYRYAQVFAWDTTTGLCTVSYPDAPDVLITIKMGSIYPTSVGQWVRVDGLPGDRFLADVMLNMGN